MNEYILRVEDKSLLSAIKKMLALLPGVTLLPVKKVRKTGMDEALEDVSEGRVYSASSVADFMYQMNH
ncbi:MAG: hypothetical protein NC048_02955 [Bacteroides sp.]|nr:hypothetical protein [Ruminococcus flavefaciens]MCM1554435.1 hypothetical protein [Bacteroides sp.]